MAEENGVGERVSVQPDKNVAKKYDVFVTERVFDDCYNLFSPACDAARGRRRRPPRLDARRRASGFASRCKRRPLGEGVSFTVDFGADETKEMWVTLKMPLATAGRWNAVQVWADVWFDTENWVSFRPRALEGPGTGLAKCGDQLGTLLYYAAGEHKVTRKNVVTARFCLCPRDGAAAHRDLRERRRDAEPALRGHGASFPGWHLPMLECERRNKAFVEAVQRVVRRRKEKDCARSLATHKRLHPPVRIFDFDFANVGELTRTKDHALSFTEEGCCNGFALYFDLDLDGETLSTAPDGPPTCWFQSLRYFREPINVKPGTTATLRAAHAASSVAAEVVDVVPPIPEGLATRLTAPTRRDTAAAGGEPLGEPK
ncbi:dolichyldiphosphatase [Aureococcus anophagefferens]|nr:dolichyldiphosphatase [Aureococcus anophagefferens]